MQSGRPGCVRRSGYNITWAKEFRYDGARSRYAVYDLNTSDLKSGTVTANSSRWSDYDGDDVYMDLGLRNFEPGIARIEPPFDPLDPQGGDDTMYYHTDHLGTTRLMSDDSGYAATGWYDTSATDVTPSVFTAFGEPITGPLDGESNRYGYVGAHGYQSHDEMPFLHVGHRYYDPGSGRFLQRDPIGIASGSNVYTYVNAGPLVTVDPSGLIAGEHNPNIPGDGPSSSRPAPVPDPQKERNEEGARNLRKNTQGQSMEDIERERRRKVRIAISAGVGIGVISVSCPFILPYLPVGYSSSGAVSSTVGGLAGIIGGVAAWE